MAEPRSTPVYYELWENRSANLLAEFDSEDEALQFVRDAVQDGAPSAVLSWSLHRSDEAVPVAYGKALYALLDRRMPA